MIKHLNIKVTGKVQGVFFRDSTRKKAKELGIKGFVCNKANGSVYIEAEGDEKTLQQFIDWCNEGPPKAEVEKVSSVPAPPVGFDLFEIRY